MSTWRKIRGHSSSPSPPNKVQSQSVNKTNHGPAACQALLWVWGAARNTHRSVKAWVLQPHLPACFPSFPPSFRLSFLSRSALSLYILPDPVYGRFNRTTRHSWNSKRGIEGKELWKSPEEGSIESACKSEKAADRRPQSCVRRAEGHKWKGIWAWVRRRLSFWAGSIQTLSQFPQMFFRTSPFPVLGSSWQKEMPNSNHRSLSYQLPFSLP